MAKANDMFVAIATFSIYNNQIILNVNTMISIRLLCIKDNNIIGQYITIFAAVYPHVTTCCSSGTYIGYEDATKDHFLAMIINVLGINLATAKFYLKHFGPCEIWMLKIKNMFTFSKQFQYVIFQISSNHLRLPNFENQIAKYCKLWHILVLALFPNSAHCNPTGLEQTYGEFQ